MTKSTPQAGHFIQNASKCLSISQQHVSFQTSLSPIPSSVIAGEGKETCPETRREMVNIRKSCLDSDWGSDHVCATQLIRVRIIVPLLMGRAGPLSGSWGEVCIEFV
jgi:hypothetical protein